ncbi:zinc finger CCHC domain-containing protein 3-like [Hyla sarda]|uniref:zinc finger CCHC domain-containing protein 3-like n=1 Tax=Hyla sarda TaxID=327740 RepID=UPI0024C310A7|nr:zinc finger CCHC domain-containing protein 3-like [Hyla sarda]
MTVCDLSDNVSAEGSASQSVWDLGSSLGSGPPLVQPSEACDPQSIEVDGGEGAVQSDAQHFPPLVTQVSDPPSTAGQQPPQRPQVQQEGRSSGASSGNAWSRGSPFMSNVNYTGQAFKRRNVVRFRHRGAKEELPDRRFVVRELLCHQMGFLPSNILAVINLPDRQGYDVSFKLMSDLDRFWAHVTRVRDADGWNKFSFVPISRPDTANVTIIFWNESVPPQDIVVWLKRHCDLMSDLTKTRDEDGIWTGGWKVLVKLRQINNITQHLPNSFFIGREKGVCFYAGQPRKCFKCGKTGHIASVCTLVKCNLCGEIGHVSATCQNIRCNLCGDTFKYSRTVT